MRSCISWSTDTQKSSLFRTRQTHKLQIRKSKKKIGYANRKSAKCHICGRSAKLTNYFSLQICIFCDLRTDYRWSCLGQSKEVDACELFRWGNTYPFLFSVIEKQWIVSHLCSLFSTYHLRLNVPFLIAIDLRGQGYTVVHYFHYFFFM